MKKKMSLLMQATYDRRQDRITLTADNKHRELTESGFHVVLKAGTQSESALRKLMTEAGYIEPAQMEPGFHLGMHYPDAAVNILKVFIESNRSILVTGLTGSGKSTLLSAMVNHAYAINPRAVFLAAGNTAEYELDAQVVRHGSATRRGMPLPDAGYDLMVKDEIDHNTLTLPAVQQAVDGEAQSLLRASFNPNGKRGTVYAAVHASGVTPDLAFNAASMGFSVIVHVRHVPNTSDHELDIYLNGAQING